MQSQLQKVIRKAKDRFVTTYSWSGINVYSITHNCPQSFSILDFTVNLKNNKLDHDL